MINFLIVLIACCLAFWPTFSADFLQFDDPQHIFLNAAVQNFPNTINLIFTQSINKIYLPLTTLSFGIEKYFFGFNPFVFHTVNVILHLAVCAAIFVFLKRLNLNPIAATFAVLIFAIHPMKVESVAWVTERKDVLYGLFYVLSLIAYMDYVKKNSWGHYLLAMLFALLSILSKPMALSLPLILFLLDWFLRRGFTLRTVGEKIPFAVIAAGIGWITYAQNMRNPITDYASSALVWIWSCSFYIWKFFVPINVYPFYKLPEPVALSSWIYISSTAFFVAWIISLFLWRHRRLYIFAAGFYFFSIFFLLRFDVGVDASIVNDRFMYLPGLGFCMLLGLLCHHLWKYRLGRIVIITFIALLIVKTHTQSRIWKNTLTFYTEVIRAYPNAFSGYNNRAHFYYKAGQLPFALADYNKAIELAPLFARNYIGRGTIHGMMGQHQKAIDDFTTALSIDPNLAESYFNRSIAENALGLREEALRDALKAASLGLPVPAAYLEKLK
jgi:hypothetical protein